MPASTYVTSLGTGTGGVGTYNLSTTPGTIANEAVTSTRNGTWVTFNYAFAEAFTPQITPNPPANSSGVVPQYVAIADFISVPNPVGFAVLIYNTSGTRETSPFSWTASGY